MPSVLSRQDLVLQLQQLVVACLEVEQQLLAPLALVDLVLLLQLRHLLSAHLRAQVVDYLEQASLHLAVQHLHQPIHLVVRQRVLSSAEPRALLVHLLLRP
jgi:hypothetical protein